MGTDAAGRYFCDNKIVLATPDGFQLRCWVKIPNDAMAAVILCHGITADSTESGFFTLIERRFADIRIGCIRFDFRGHGASSGSPSDVTLSGQLSDLGAVRSWLDGFLNIPVFYLAASFGASAAVHDALRHPTSGLVLINPIVDYAGIFVRGESEWGAAIVASRTDADSDPAGWIPDSDYVLARRLLEEIESDDTFELLLITKIPTLLFHGSADKLVPISPAFALAAANRLIKIVTYEGGRHGLKGFRADLLEQAQNWVLGHA